MLFQGPTYVGRKKCLHPVREKSRDTLICHSRPWKKFETRRSSTDSRTVWKITLSIRKSSSTYHKRVSRFDWRIRETRRVGALACSRVPRACAHIAKGLNGLLIDLSVQRGNVYQRLRCPRESFSSFYNILQNLFVRMKIDRRFAIEQKGIIIRNQSAPSFFLSFFNENQENVIHVATVFEEHFTLVMLRPIRQKLAGGSSTSVARDAGSGIKVTLFLLVRLRRAFIHEHDAI